MTTTLSITMNTQGLESKGSKTLNEQVAVENGHGHKGIRT